ncbi:hypothetical protein PDJAM_G00187070 [Pangasius djambal]|uniref:Uncharacterized protein n=1 Tax=Pangasius djambal TaxID=1691987 RepID=A0ACC5Y6Q0_9TELE|nr:hypothetical protein [Pangasius djambal]
MSKARSSGWLNLINTGNAVTQISRRPSVIRNCCVCRRSHRITQDRRKVRGGNTRSQKPRLTVDIVVGLC